MRAAIAGDPTATREDLAQVGARLEELVGDHYGQRPRARTQARQVRDCLVVTFSDVLAPFEQALIAAGRAWLVREMRSAFQDVMAPEYRAGVQELTGRRVVSQASSFSLERGTCRLVFVMAPATEGWPAQQEET